MLQAETSKTIRHPIIAIGALSLRIWPSNSDEKRRRQFAYEEYALAIKAIREETAASSANNKITLLASILFFYFEIFHSNNGAAVSLPFSPAKSHSSCRMDTLIVHWEQNFYVRRVAQVHSMINFMVEEQRLLEEGRGRNVERHAPMVDDEIIQVIVHLELQIMTVADQYFESLDQAWKILNIVLKRSLHWLATMMPVSFKQGLIFLGRSNYFLYDVNPVFSQRAKILSEYE
ncbi:hypothetical protein B0O99DRAFT_687445 [Bisporella sp. PMI_857]|nr:hypothetical protein B0O99DRAFT_687445 [Bisporella sp. PMI_857]